MSLFGIVLHAVHMMFTCYARVVRQNRFKPGKTQEKSAPSAVATDLCVPTCLVFFDIGQSLLVALPFVLSFSHWSVAVGGIWLVRFHSSCLF